MLVIIYVVGVNCNWVVLHYCIAIFTSVKYLSFIILLLLFPHSSRVWMCVCVCVVCCYVQSVTSELETQENKYTVKPPRDLKSHFVAQQEKKRQQEAEAALFQKLEEVLRSSITPTQTVPQWQSYYSEVWCLQINQETMFSFFLFLLHFMNLNLLHLVCFYSKALYESILIWIPVVYIFHHISTRFIQTKVQYPNIFLKIKKYLSLFWFEKSKNWLLDYENNYWWILCWSPDWQIFVPVIKPQPASAGSYPETPAIRMKFIEDIKLFSSWPITPSRPSWAAERAAVFWPSARAVGALLGPSALWKSERPGELLHWPPDRDQIQHRCRRLPGHRECVEQSQLLCQHAGLQRRLRCESTTTAHTIVSESQSVETTDDECDGHERMVHDSI